MQREVFCEVSVINVLLFHVYSETTDCTATSTTEMSTTGTPAASISTPVIIGAGTVYMYVPVHSLFQ